MIRANWTRGTVAALLAFSLVGCASQGDVADLRTSLVELSAKTEAAMRQAKAAEDRANAAQQTAELSVRRAEAAEAEAREAAQRADDAARKADAIFRKGVTK